MPTQIDSKALVSTKAQLDDGVTIGPYAVIGDNVKIGAGSVIDSFAQVLGYTEIGKKCHIFPYAVVGNIPQDLKYKGEKSFLIIGDENRIREFVTINPGTEEGTYTILGSNNLVMAYSHIAHDCRIGNNNILANAATLAGYVEIGNNVVIGGLVAIHQFCRLGDFSIVGGCSKVVQDIPPYSMCDGHPAEIHSINYLGLKRLAFPADTIRALRNAFKILFFEKHSFTEAQRLVLEHLPSSKELELLLTFITSTKRGISKPH
ncbi:MAG: acyl-ACP--UDP-N-acetylglucosamine O-acyltransferase [Candidatus Omnitrophica bacterium]|jgi:UDP-N-acetylglucosamine acyltransferase|nr:acyl-ACP--UDP-N-acetylglucosamine O-acyltransferase [Candidatus Omnitrophota bacterium]